MTTLQQQTDHTPIETSTTPQSQQEADTLTCAICCSDILDDELIVKLRCSHLYHSVCLKEQFTKSPNQTCALCRSEVCLPWLFQWQYKGMGSIQYLFTTEEIDEIRIKWQQPPESDDESMVYEDEAWEWDDVIFVGSDEKKQEELPEEDPIEDSSDSESESSEDEQDRYRSVLCPTCKEFLLSYDPKTMHKTCAGCGYKSCSCDGYNFNYTPQLEFGDKCPKCEFHLFGDTVNHERLCVGCGFKERKSDISTGSRCPMCERFTFVIFQKPKPNSSCIFPRLCTHSTSPAVGIYFCNAICSHCNHKEAVMACY